MLRASPLWAALAFLAVVAPGCPEPPAGISASADIGPAGGAIALDGGVLVIPAGAVPRTIRFTLTRLPTPAPSTDAVTDLWRAQPDDVDLAVPARVTLPITAFASFAVARWSLPGSTTDFEDVAPIAGAATVITSERARLGRIFGDRRDASDFDAGMPDAPPFDAPPRDAPLPDVPPVDVGPDPIPPVTVGVDLRPANYACLRTRTAPVASGTPVTTAFRVVELLDGGARATFFDGSDELGALGAGSSDSTGMASLALRPDAWTRLAFARTSGATEALSIPPQIVDRLTFDPSGTSRVEVVSTRTFSAIVNVVTPFFEMRGAVFGTIRDCDGVPVQRARLRMFVDATGEELDRGIDTSGIAYSSGATRLPNPSADRTSVNGLYFAVTAGDSITGLARTVRFEVWGALTLGAAEELLACEVVPTRDDGPVLLALDPLRADAAPTCP